MKSVETRCLLAVSLLVFTSCRWIRDNVPIPMLPPSVDVTAKYYGGDNKEFTDSVKALIAQEKKLGCMVMPQGLGANAAGVGDTPILDAVASSGLRVVSALDSLDAAKVSRYKNEIGNKSFKIADEDKDKFEGIQYIVVYTMGSNATSAGGRPVYTSSIDMKFWWIRGGDLVATVTATTEGGPANDFASLAGKIAAELARAGLPGTKPMTAEQAK